jgi:hypothetical protein
VHRKKAQVLFFIIVGFFKMLCPQANCHSYKGCTHILFLFATTLSFTMDYRGRKQNAGYPPLSLYGISVFCHMILVIIGVLHYQHPEEMTWELNVFSHILQNSRVPCNETAAIYRFNKTGRVPLHSSSAPSARPVQISLSARNIRVALLPSRTNSKTSFYNMALFGHPFDIPVFLPHAGTSLSCLL